jgi:hypothetical protein
MRGIERFVAAILLAGAVGGAAAFARYAGTEPEPPAFHLSASPRQHLTIPQTVVEIPLPTAPRRVAVKPVVIQRPRLDRVAPTIPARHVVVAPVTAPQPAPVAPAAPPAPVQAPPPAPAPPPTQTVAAPAAPAPVDAPAEPRVLAVQAPPPPVEATASKQHGHGKGNNCKAKGHDKTQGDQGDEGDDVEGGGAAVAPPAEQPSVNALGAPVDQASPASTPPTPVPAPTDGNGDSQGDSGQGNSWQGNSGQGDSGHGDSGQNHGHGNGHGG